ncbi:peptide-methionine (S)-S-oxide reductase MsrA [Tenacibaculum sp. TC6]|uniref:peptide-methionine (S)-S-oxide reductase MsrA n=1 Tax=Tenacibaculum sp. TC6 TaxID=3423223 RepID=UPI003D359C1B
MRMLKITTSLVFVLVLSGFTLKPKKERVVEKTNQKQAVAYFASGCFWCVEAVFESVKGVKEAVSGYAGGHSSNPTYQKVGSGSTGHAEAVAVYYNPDVVSFQTLVDVFFGSQDPTTVNGQYPDYGTQYRSIAFYQNAKEKEIIEHTIEKLNKEVYNGKIATEVVKFTKFYKAEEYHQNYERLHPENPYVQKVSIPRLNRFKRKFPHLLKDM